MKNKMVLGTLREIKNSLGRYLAILAIVALGVGFFGGLKTTKPAMIDTLDSFLEEENFFDIRLVNTLGFEDEDVERLEEMAPEGVLDIEASKYMDALLLTDKGNEGAYRIYMMPDKVNLVYLMSGRMPEKPGECLIDDYMSGNMLGDILKVTENNTEDTLDNLTEHELTVVGTIRSPLYINYERGTTSIGNGSIRGFIYVPKECFGIEYYTDVYVKLDTDEYGLYTDEYKDYVKEYENRFEDILKTVADERYNRILSTANDELKDARDEFEEKKRDGEKELSDALKEIEEGEKEIKDNEVLLADGEEALIEARDELRKAEKNYENEKAKLESMKVFMTPEQALYAENELAAGRYEIDRSWTLLREKQEEIRSSREKLEDAKTELSKGRKEYEDGLKEFDEKIADAEAKIAEAEDEIKDIKEPSTYVLNRSTNVGYACYDADSNIVESVSNVFPVFFFLVAVLICMTTMNRMIEEQRTEIGIYKALGFSFNSIMGKYMFYACSSSITGAVIGYALGTVFMPKAIWQGYNIMYNMGANINPVYIPWLAISSIMAAILCAVGSVYFSVVYEIREVPANLIRPKAPKAGKRVFLEYITPIWSRMKFLHKVSIRNVFRYKKRFFMMVIGISGCTALVVTGFGIGDSIKGIANRQFDSISVYDVSATFSDDFSLEDMTELNENKDASDIAYFRLESADIETQLGTKSINVVIPKDKNKLLAFLNLMTDKGMNINYPEGEEAVITAQIASTLGIEIGDEISLKDPDMNERRVKISAVCENYVYNYIYLSEDPDTKINTAWMNASGDVHELSTSVSKMDHAMSVTVIKDLEERIDNMMKSMDFIVLIIIVCAGALAFIVVYNLTNINITERIREIATIKVLGFYSNEASQYVFRENMILTGIGALCGLPLGKFLHSFIMYNIRIDMMSFKTYISLKSYIISILMTFAFALFVNFLMGFKLRRINMAESLKSIE